MAWIYCKCGQEIDEPTAEQDLSTAEPTCPACGREHFRNQEVGEYVLALLARVDTLEHALLLLTAIVADLHEEKAE